MPRAIVREGKGRLQHGSGLSEEHLRARTQGSQRRKQNEKELGRFFPREAGSGQGPGTWNHRPSLVNEHFVPGDQWDALLSEAFLRLRKGVLKVWAQPRPRGTRDICESSRRMGRWLLAVSRALNSKA